MPEIQHDVVRLMDANSVPMAVCDDAVVQRLGATFALVPLEPESLRDARLLAFLMDVDSGRVGTGLSLWQKQLGSVNEMHDRLLMLSGISRGRVETGIARLVQASVLEWDSESATGCYRFSGDVIQPVGAGQFVDWSAVLAVLGGRSSALIVLCAVLDLLRQPWEWGKLTHEAIALQASYSLGMAQRGLAELLRAGVLERATHAGRGHDYRLTHWAMGRGPGPTSQDTMAIGSVDRSVNENSVRTADLAAVPRLASSVDVATDSGPMVVEIGGLIVRVPSGTEIRMTLAPDGTPVYQLGAEMRITRRQ